MILHLVPDEKVIPRAINQFEQAYPKGNIFICFKDKGIQVRFVKESKRVFYYYSRQANTINFNEVHLVCFHYLDESKLRYYYKHHLNKKLTLLIPWGADLFNTFLPRFGYKIFADNNSYLVDSVKFYTPRFPSFLQSIIKYIKISRSRICAYKQESINRLKINFLENDLDYLQASKGFYEVLNKYVKLNNVKSLVEYTYYPIEDVLGSLSNSWCKGNNVMIGNSASFTNNHEYIYEYLCELDISEVNLILPMNYGGNSRYNEIVISKFMSLPNCIILRDFLPLEEYNKLMLGASTFIYGHFRDEAKGNILIALYLGGKVYMSKYSQLYKDLAAQGFYIFELESIRATYYDELSMDHKLHNRYVALSHYSADINKECVRKICELSYSLNSKRFNVE